MEPAETEPAAPSPQNRRAKLQGAVAGVLTAVVSVATGALLFGSYGYTMFVIAPFMVGVLTAFFANRKSDIGGGATTRLTLGTAAFSGAVLMLLALEGLVCLLLMAPLGLGLAYIGGYVGRDLAVKRHVPTRRVMSSIVVLPVVFALEAAFPASVSFETSQDIRIDAGSARVWQAITRMGTIEEQPALPFRLGMAYPISAVIKGEGIGAERKGVFSTGTAIERITEWVPHERLAYEVVEDIPAMREMSFYKTVHAPHVIGYFETTGMSYSIVGDGQGASKLVLKSAHRLRLDPALYWLPMARWVVEQNNARVLRHVKRSAERQH